MDEPSDTPVTTAPPRTYLLGSLLVAALAFLPTGLVAVGLSWRARVLVGRGEYGSARNFGRAALGFVIASLVLGVVVYVALIGALLALGAFSGG